jgi:hypothetical protein
LTFSTPTPFTSVESSFAAASDMIATLLLQLRVLGFGFLQDGDVGICVFPER